MNVLKRNAICNVIYDGANYISMMCCTGPVIQTFLSSIGMSSQWIYINTMLIQTVNMLTVFLCARWADHGNVIRKTGGALLSQAVLFLFYLPLCIHPSSSQTASIYLRAVCLAQAVTTGLYTVCSYKLPYIVLNAETYTKVIAVVGQVSGAVSLLSGLFLTWLAGRHSYPQIMLGGCIVSCCITGLASSLVHGQKPLLNGTVQETAASRRLPISRMLRQPSFYLLAPANLARGFGYGVSSVLTVVALELGFGTQVSTAIVSVQAMATVGICFLFGLVARKNNLSLFILLGSLTFLLLPPLLHSKSGTVFLAGLFVVYSGRVLVDYAIPAILRWIVPGEIAGVYQSWRMALTYCGMMLGTMTAALISTQALMLLSAAAMLIAGLSYYFVARRLSPGDQLCL